MKIQTYIDGDTAVTATVTHYSPYRAAKTYGEPEDCEPEQHMEIEFSLHSGGNEIDVDSLDALEYLRIENELIEVLEATE